MKVNSVPVLIFFFVLLCTSFFNNPYASAQAVHTSPKPIWLKKIMPYEKKVPSRDISNGYFYQLLEEQINVEKQADYIHIIKEMVSEAGIQNASSVSIGFDPTFERLDVHEIIVWRNNKPQNRLKTSSFKVIADEKELSRFIYQGSYSAYCILDDIRKGDKIEYSYTITGRNPIFSNKFFKDLYMQSTQPIAHIYRSIQASPKRTLNFKSFNKAPNVTITNVNGLKCYEWNGYQVKPPPYFDNQPSWYNNYAYIQISEYNSWKEVTDWALSVNPMVFNLKGKLAVQVSQLKSSSGNDKEKYFRNAVKLVQDEVRYMGIELGEYSHRANNPEKVFNQRYGDCKDKALLLSAILNAGGIEAHMVLVNSSIGNAIGSFLPSPNAFDHAVVEAIVNNTPVWVDATISYQRGTGLNLYFPRYEKGLILKAGNSALTNITSPKTGKTTVVEKYNIPDEKKRARLDVTSTYTLNEADKMRDRLASSSRSETEKNYLNYYNKIYSKIEQADSLTVIDNEQQNTLTTIEHYLITDFLKYKEEKYTGYFYANYINDRLSDVPNNASTPIALNYPCDMDYTIKVFMPAGFNIDPEKNSIKRDDYMFSRNSSVSGDTLLLNYRLTLLSDFVPVNKLAECRGDMKQISSDELAYRFTYTPKISNKPFRINYWMALYAIILVLTFAFIGFKIYSAKTNAVVFEPGATFIPLGGWLIFIAFGLGASVIMVLATTLGNGYFDLNKWYLTVPVKYGPDFKTILVLEATANILLMCYAAFCFVLLLNKRDILPKYIIGLYIFALAFSVGDFVLVAAINNGGSNQPAVSAIVRATIGAAIWIPYFKRSVRVEQTFVVPYPANNYTYEEASTLKATDNV